MYAVSENAMELIDILLKKKGIDVNKKDSQGKNVVHYVVNPLPYGSYENVALLEMLHKRSTYHKILKYIIGDDINDHCRGRIGRQGQLRQGSLVLLFAPRLQEALQCFAKSRR